MLNREFNLKPSIQYTALLSAILFLSILIIISLTLETWIKYCAIIFVGVYGAYLFWRFALLRSRNAILSIKLLNDGSWQLYTRDKIYTAKLSGDSTATNLISVLRFRTDKHYWPKSCLIFRDSLEYEQYRRLLVALRMY